MSWQEEVPVNGREVDCEASELVWDVVEVSPPFFEVQIVSEALSVYEGILTSRGYK